MFVREENNSNNNSTKLVEGLKSYLQDTLQSTQLAKHLQYFSTGISIQCLAEINSRSHFLTSLRYRWGLLVWFAFEVGVLKARGQPAVPLPGFINCLISAVRNRKLCSEQGNTRRVAGSHVSEGTGRSVSLAVTRETRLPLRQGRTDGRRRKHRVQPCFSPTDSKQRENSRPHAEMAPRHSNSFCGTPLKASIGFPPSLLVIYFLLKKRALYGSQFQLLPAWASCQINST